jgi:hypothetical protein
MKLLGTIIHGRIIEAMAPDACIHLRALGEALANEPMSTFNTRTGTRSIIRETKGSLSFRIADLPRK